MSSLILTEVAAPAAAPAGKVVLFVNTSGVLQQVDDLGNVTTVGNGAAQVNADWNATSGVALIENKPTIPAAQVNSDWNATSGLAVIENKPTIPAVATVMVASGTGHAAGLTPDPGATAGTTRYLREDATWQPVTAGIADAPTNDGLAYVRRSGSWVLKDKVVLNWLWNAIDTTMTGGIPTKIVIMGDSNTVGQGAGTGNVGGQSNNLVGARPYSATQQMVALLIAAGIPCTSDSFFGDQNIAANGGSAAVSLYDPRLQIGTGWSAAEPANTLGGCFWQAGGQVAGALAFTPAVNHWDQCDIYYVSIPGGATEVDVSQGSTKIGSFNCASGSIAVGKATFTGTLQAATLNITQTVGGSGTAFVIGAVCRNSTSPSVEVYQCGWGGATLDNLADTSSNYTPSTVLAKIAPNFTSLQCTVNGVTGGATVADYAAGLATIGNVALASGNFEMVVGFPGNTIGTTGGPAYAPLLDGYRRVMEAFALNTGGFVTDLREIFGNSWASANAKSLVFDSYHPNRAGYTIEAQRFFDLIMSARS